MASDSVEGQSWAFIRCRYKIAVWDEAELDQCLETIADTEDEPVAVIEQIPYGIGYLR